MYDLIVAVAMEKCYIYKQVVPNFWVQYFYISDFGKLKNNII